MASSVNGLAASLGQMTMQAAEEKAGQNSAADVLHIPREPLAVKLFQDYGRRLPGLTSIKVDLPITVGDVQRLIQEIRSIQVFDVTILPEGTLPLCRFEQHKELRELTLRVERAALETTLRILPFPDGCKLPITSMSLLRAALCPGFTRSLAGLPLQHLSLEGSELWDVRDLPRLIAYKQLQSLHLEGVMLDKDKPNLFKGQLHLLHKHMPNTAVLPQDTLRDRWDYRDLFTTTRQAVCSYSLEEIRAGKWNRAELETLYAVAGQDEDDHWIASDRYVLVHNHSYLPHASPIHCLDKRRRVAAQEPIDSEPRQFFEYAFQHNVTFIVMLKKIESPCYIPLEVGHTYRIEQTDNAKEIVIECTKKEYDKVTQRTLRELTIGEKKIYHMQIDWENMAPIDVDRLLPFLREVRALEKQHPGGTVVHCWGGKGRTGVFFSCLNVDLFMDQFTPKIEKPPQLYFNVEESLRALRQDRRGMIETPNQLINILQFLQKILLTLTPSM